MKHGSTCSRLACLFTLISLPQPKMQDIIQLTGQSSTTVKRNLEYLKDEGVVVGRTKGKRHGHYIVESTGIFNPSELRKLIAEKEPNLFYSVRELDMNRSRQAMEEQEAVAA